MNEDDLLKLNENDFIYLDRETMRIQYEMDQKKKEAEKQESKEENFIETRDKDGNLIGKPQKNSDPEIERLKRHRAKFPEDFIELKDWRHHLEDQMKENEIEREDDEEPKWTEVRGSSSFYHICPICGSMIPGTGPKIDCADGVSRLPKELHEWWHKTVACDWYQD